MHVEGTGKYSILFVYLTDRQRSETKMKTNVNGINDLGRNLKRNQEMISLLFSRFYNFEDKNVHFA